MTRDEIVADLERQLKGLRPAIDALADIGVLEQAAADANRAERAYLESPGRPRYQTTLDHRAIELNGNASRARDLVTRTSSEGNEALRRAHGIKALLDAPADLQEAKKRLQEVRAEEAMLRERADKATALVDSIRNEIARLEHRRSTLIDQGAEDRLEGKADSSAKPLAQIDAQMTIERRALEGAERKLADAKQRVEEWPERERQANVAVRRARAKLGELDRRVLLASVEQEAARCIAAQRLVGDYEDELVIRPSPTMIEAVSRELEAELRGEAA